MNKVTRRNIIKGLAGAGAASTLPTTNAQAVNSTPLSRICFGSCCNQDKPQPIWGPILAQDPQLFLFLGDNIYADTHDMDVMRDKYARQTNNYAAVRNHCPVHAIWDDHDFGENDVGTEYPHKADSRDLFLKFWGDDPLHSRRRDDEGIYHAAYYGPTEQRVQIIMPDLRYHRSPPQKVSQWQKPSRLLRSMGPYAVLDKSSSQMSERQWQWLELQLQQPAKLRIIASSLQFLADYTGWESWAQYPGDRQRMIKLIRKTRAEGVIFISGDTHWGEISHQNDDTPYPLYDVTSSGLTETWSQVSPNRHRLREQFYALENFGQITVDWQQADPVITLSVKDIEGHRRIEQQLPLSQLSLG